MADIDMIPRSYRAALRARRAMAGYGTALALLALGGGATGALLRWRLAAEAPRLERLRAAERQADAMRARLAQLGQRRDALAQEVQALAALRGVGDAGALAASLDGALNDRVWVERLAFSRSQEALQTPAAGMLVSHGQAWRLSSNVEIAAQASDRDAMTSFLAALAASPMLSDVRFLNSKAGDTAVAFSVAGALRRKEQP
jgi:Tfp pilus assembly protein PilN